MIIWQLLSNLSHFYSSPAIVLSVPLLFHLKKDRLNTYLLRNTNTFVKYLKSFEMQQIK